MKQPKDEKLSFWDHLEELRKVIFRILPAVLLAMTLVFICKDQIFKIILAPQSDSFIFYRWLCRLSEILHIPSLCPSDFNVELINTQLVSQFMIHIRVSLYIGILLVSPYVIYQIFRFVSPALYENERKYAFRVIVFSTLLFFFGILLSYFILFPLTFRFLSTYQVSETVKNLINLSSYVDTLMMLSLMMGIMSEIPILSWFFAKLGFINAQMMKKFRKYAIVILLVISAVITPSGDAFTLMVVFLPIYLLYEISILIVSSVKSRK